MSATRLQSLTGVAAQTGLASAAIYYSYLYMPAFFAYWDSKQPLQWWAARATGFAAYGALAASMLCGLMVSSRGLDGAVGRKTVTDYHQQWTLAALILTVLHTVIILTDEYVDISVVGGLVPGQSAHLTGAVALGTFALWGMAIIIVSSWLRSFISYELWRMIHASATAVLLLALVHGFVAGTDSKHDYARVLYVASGALVFGATVFRLTYEFRKPRAALPASNREPTPIRRPNSPDEVSVNPSHLTTDSPPRHARRAAASTPRHE